MNPQERGEGAAGLRREPWQESNDFGLSQCYLSLLPGGVNPDTATVQLWKQHPLILLMTSSLQYLLIKEAFARLDNRPICSETAAAGDGRALALLSSTCSTSRKAKTSLVREAMSWLSYDILKDPREIPSAFCLSRILLIFLPLPQNTRSSWSDRNQGVSSRPLSSRCL